MRYLSELELNVLVCLEFGEYHNTSIHALYEMSQHWNALIMLHGNTRRLGCY